MAKRYNNLYNLIKTYKPQTICEVGTNAGARAIRMSLAALKYNKNVSYLGYDLFELSTEETDRKEMNGKKNHPSVKELRRKFKNAISKKHPSYKFVFVKGNTNDTITKGSYDFVFIDGGHSIATINSDYSRLKNSTIVILDDYYYPENDPVIAERIKGFGCNELAHRLQKDNSLRVEILPLSDGEGENSHRRIGQVLIMKKSVKKLH